MRVADVQERKAAVMKQRDDETKEREAFRLQVRALPVALKRHRSRRTLWHSLQILQRDTSNFHLRQRFCDP